jgi:cytochrome c
VAAKAGTYPNYHYSDANPEKPARQGSRHQDDFSGFSEGEDIDNVIAYLKQFGANGKKS